MTDDEFDPEEYAGEVAARIAARHVLAIAVKVLLVTFAFLAIGVGARVFAVLTLWHVPDWVIGFVASIVVADLVRMAHRLTTGVRQHRREKAETAHLTKEQQAGLRVEQRRSERVAYEQHRSWRSRLRRPHWWTGRAVDAVYLTCVGVVITAWYSPLVGGATVIITCGVAVVLWWVGRRFMPTLFAMSGFFDPTVPKDTPEV